MAAIGKVSIELEAKIAKLETDLGRAARVMEKEFSKMRGTVERQTNVIKAKAEETGALIGRAFNVAAAGYVVAQLRRVADEYANISARVRLASGANADYEKSFQAVMRTSMATYASLQATTNLVQKISTGLQSTGVGAQEAFNKAIALTEIFNKALVVSGAGTIQAEAAMLQFSQAIAKGKLDGDEFRSVAENNSRFMLLLADSLGVTVGELYKLREEGKLTVDALYSVLNNTEQLNAEFGSFPVTIGRAMQNLDTAVTAFVGSMDQALGISQAVAKIIVFVAENMNIFGAAIALTAVALASRYIGAAAQAIILSRALAVELGIATASATGLNGALLLLAGNPLSVAILAGTAALVGLGYALDTAIDQANAYADSVERTRGVLDQAFDLEIKIGFEQAGTQEIESVLASVRGEAARVSSEIDTLRGEAKALDGSFWKTADTIDAYKDTLKQLSERQDRYNFLIQTAISLSRDLAAAKEKERQAAAVAAAAESFGKDVEKEIENINKQRVALQDSAAAMADYARNVAIANAAKKKGAPLTAEELQAYIDLGEKLKENYVLLEQETRAHREANQSRKEGEKTAKKQAEELLRLAEAQKENLRAAKALMAEGMGPYQKIQQELLNSIDEWKEKLSEGEATVEAYSMAIMGLTQEYVRNKAALDDNVAKRAQENQIVERMIEGHQREAEALGLVGRELFIHEELTRAAAERKEQFNRKNAESAELSREEAAALRDSSGALYDKIEATRLAEEASQQFANVLISAAQQGTDAFAEMFVEILSGNADLESGFEDLGDALVDIFKRSVAQILSQILQLKIVNPILNSILGGIGVNLPTSGGLFSSLLGGGAFAGARAGVNGQMAAPTGLFGNNQGGFGSFGGNVIGAVGGLYAGSQGIRTGNVGQAALGGASAGFAVGGPVGAAIGAIVGGLAALINGKKEPDFRLGGSSARVRSPEGSFSTVFGSVQAGSRQISYESLIKPIQDFDAAIQGMVAGISGGEAQLQEIKDALSRWVVDLKGDAATAENVLGSRFSTILSTFSQDVQDFVGSTGSVEQRVSALADALAIEDIVDLGEWDMTFSQVADLLTDYRVGTESLTDTYARINAATELLDAAMDISGQRTDMTRESFMRFASDIVEAAGGLDQAADLWQGYFEAFYSEQERAQLRATRAQENAASAFGQIGLNVTDFQGKGGMAAFRALFESMMPTLSAEAYVAWLNAANALAGATDAQVQYNAALQQIEEITGIVSGNIADFMAQIESGFAEFENLTIEERLSALAAQNAALVEQAIALGATEEQIARVRELGQLRMNQLLDEQAQMLEEQSAAASELSLYVGRLAAQATGGITPLTSSLLDLRAEYDAHIARINELARAAGRASASEEELAAAHSWYAAQISAVIAGLMSQASSLISQLYGTGGGGGGGSFGGGGGGGGGDSQLVGEIENRYEREMDLLRAIQEFIDSMDLSNLSPLTPQERLAAAQSNFQDILSRAMGGDLDALAQLQGAAQSYLGEAQGYYGGVGAYSSIYESVMASLQAILDRGPLNQDNGGGTGTGGGGGGSITVDPGQGFIDLSELERFELATQLAETLRDLIAATGLSLIEVSEQLGLDLRALVTDLGVNLDELTVTTTVNLADIARQLGVNLTELAQGVGVSLGDLGDEQSLLNEALEQTIEDLPPEFRERLRGLLEAIERATIEGDPTEAVQDAEEAITLMPPEIRDALAPYFEAISSPTDDLLDYAVQQTTILGNINYASDTANGFLSRIATATEAAIATPPPPESVAAVVEATPTAFLQKDTPADMLRNEMRAIKEELVAMRKVIADGANNSVQATGRVEAAIKSNPASRRA